MEIEGTLRAAFVLHEPRVDFEEVVMARLAAGTWRASQPVARKRRNLLLTGSLLAVSAAAAMWVARYSGSATAPAMPVARQVESISTTVTAAAPMQDPAPPAGVPPAATPPTAPRAVDVSQPCEVAAATPVPVTYTVLLAPLQSGLIDPAMQSAAQDYYDAVVRQLRSTPGLGLVMAGTPAMDARQADYRVTVMPLAADEWPRATNPGGQWLKLQLEAWNGTAFQVKGSSASNISSVDNRNCPEVPGRNCAATAGSMAAGNFVGNGLPRLTTAAQTACDRSRVESVMRQFAEQRVTDPSIDMGRVRDAVQRLANVSQSIQRGNMTGMRLRVSTPEMREPLLAALREATDDAARQEIVTLLAVRFAGDVTVRQALAAVVASGTDTLTRHVAQRAVSGEGPWRDYVLARLRDSSLSPAQRLQPLYWMADTLPLDQQMLGAEIAAMLTELQRSDGIRQLAEFVAGTQQTGEAALSPLVQQGQRTMRQIATVDHPAVAELLGAYFDAAPNYLTLGALATRRDLPEVMRKLESIAAAYPDAQLQRSAGNYLRQPLNPSRPAPPGN